MATPLKSHSQLQRVIFDLDNGQTVDALIFTSEGPLAIQEVLNDDRQFLPIQCDGELKLINKHKVVMITPA